MAPTTTRRPGEAARLSPKARPRGGSRGDRRRWATVAALGLVALVGVAFYLLAGYLAGGTAMTTLQTVDFHALAFTPSDPNTVFFGHHNGIMRSDDGGRSWRALVDRPNFDAMGLAVSRANSGQIYLAGHDIFQASTDGGATWQAVHHNLPGTDIHGFAMSPDESSNLFAFVVGNGIFESSDGGRNWQRVVGQAVGQVPGDIMALAAAGGSPETLYAASMRAGVLRSVDGGRSWAPSSNGLGARNVVAVAVGPSAPQTIYAGGHGGLYRSTDGGTNWSKLPFPGENVAALAVSPSQPNLVLAITVKGREGLVLRSSDGGATWSGP